MPSLKSAMERFSKNLRSFVWMLSNTSIQMIGIDASREEQKKVLAQFSYLQEHSFFHTISTYYGLCNYVEYRFRQWIENKLLEGIIQIPCNEKREVLWKFQGFSVEDPFLVLKGVCSDLSQTPEWFSSLVQDIEEKIERRDRLRRIFSSPK